MNKPDRTCQSLQVPFLPCLLALLLPAACLQAQGSGAVPREEIVITENMNVSQLQAKTFEAERKVYKLFNALNDDDTYDVKCISEKPTGTLMSVITCRPNYVSKLMRLYHIDDLTTSFRDGGDALDRKYEGIPPEVLKEYDDKSRELMARLAADHPDLAAAIKVHAELARQLKQRLAENN